MAILGLTTSETTADFWSQNARRKVFHQYPNGAAPLCGLLSLMGGPDWTAGSEFGWFDKRMTAQTTKSDAIAVGTNGPFSASGSDTASADPFNIADQGVIRVRCLDTSNFRVTHVLWIQDVLLADGSTTDINGVVTSVVSSTKVEIQVIGAVTGVQNGSGENVNLYVTVIGNANAEGARSGRGVYTPPTNSYNYTQIFRTPFSFTRTALKQPLTFDKTGVYKEKAKENSLNHVTEMERAMFFGQRSEVITTADDGEQVPRRTMGGLQFFLKQWEAGAFGNTAVTPGSDWTDPQRRIIKLPNNTLTPTNYSAILERAFRVTNNKDYSKLCLCGSGFLSKVNDMYRNTVTQINQVGKDTAYGMDIVQHNTLFGTVYYKVHPLFQQYPQLNNDAFFLDVQNIRYRPLLDSDTKLLANRQNTDEDRRKDEWLTECSAEFRFPESHLWLKQIQTYAA